jgi:SAM-dependent methyltransferase
MSGADERHGEPAYDPDAWERHYREHGAGHGPHATPNARVQAVAAAMSPGRALDAGCGSGADARWLAAQGWQVTAVDVSPTVLAHARAQDLAAAAAGRLRWVEADLRAWHAGDQTFDLVSSQYVHVPGGMVTVVDALACAVAPGGTLLVVGHHRDDPTSRDRGPEAAIDADGLAASLDPGSWEVVAAGTVTRAATEPDGEAVTALDEVLHAVRRG